MPNRLRIVKAFSGAIVMAGLVAGCGSSVTSNTTSGKSANTSTSSTNEPKVNAKMAIFTGATSPQTLAANKLASLVKKYTNGNVNITVYPSGQLGSAAAVLQDIQNNTVQLTVTVASIDSIVPESDVILAPYMFPSASVAMKVLDGPIMQQVWNKFSAHNMKVIGVWQFGYADLLTTKPVPDLSSLSGQSIRVMAPLVGNIVMQDFGANPTPMALNQAFTALETNALDGMEDPPATIYSGKYYQAAKNIALTKEIFVAAPVFVSSGFWNQLSDSEKNAITKAEAEVLPYEESVASQQDASDLAAMKQEGVTVTSPDLAPFKQKAADATKELANKLGPIVGQVQQAVANTK